MRGSTTRSRPHRPDVSVKVGALARERIGGLQGIAAEPPKPRVTLVGHRWDTACGDLRRFLARNQISFDWLTPDAPELPDMWPGPRPERTSDCPVLRLADGTVRVGPSAARACPIARPADERPRRRIRHRDHRRRAGRSCGGGVRRLRRAAHDRRSSARRRAARPGRLRGSRTISAFPTASRATSWRAARSSRRGGSGRRSWSRARSLASTRRRARSFLDGDDVVRARTLILATGVTWRRLAIDGFDRLIGKGIYYGAARSEAERHARPRHPSRSAPAIRPARRRCTSPTTRAR